MPRRHKTKTLEIERSVNTLGSADAIMRRITTPATWPEWQSEIVTAEGPERLAEGDVVEGRARLLGFDVRGKSTAHVVEPDVFDEDVIVGVRMRVTYRVATASGRTTVTHRIVADLPAGVAGKVLSWLLAWRLRKMQSMLLERLKEQAEREQAERDQAERDPS